MTGTPLGMGCMCTRIKPGFLTKPEKYPHKVYTNDQFSHQPESNGIVRVKPTLSKVVVSRIQDSWDKLHSDIVRVGVVMFTRLFETHPDVQDSFMDFRHMSLEDIRHSKTLREHGLRVMTTVEKVLARIGDPNKLEAFITSLGKQHVTYKANINYIRLVGPQFVNSIKSELEDVWTEETEKAWLKLFDYITYVMQQGMISVGTDT